MARIELNHDDKVRLKALGIEALILFGSEAQGTAGALSDVDVGLLLPPLVSRRSREKRNKIYDVLYDMLSAKIKRLVNIDIVFLEDAPMELQSHVAKYGLPIFEAKSDSFVCFRERVMDMYADFAPIRAIFQRATLARIPT